MITYSSIIRYDNLPWQEYLALLGYSFSWLKRESSGSVSYFEPSEKMKLGSMVDAILTAPHQVDVLDPQYRHGRMIAGYIIKEFGSLIDAFVPQVSYTGIAECNGFKLPVKGRLDWLLHQHAVCDLKVTDATDIAALIKFMKYDEQMFNYTGLAGVDKSYIFAYSKKINKPLPPVCIKRAVTSEWWEEKIIKFGTV